MIKLDLQGELLHANADDGIHDSNVKSDGDDNDSRDSEEGGNIRGSGVPHRPPL